jgi:hypothetical protein
MLIFNKNLEKKTPSEFSSVTVLLKFSLSELARRHSRFSTARNRGSSIHCKLSFLIGEKYGEFKNIRSFCNCLKKYNINISLALKLTTHFADKV